MTSCSSAKVGSGDALPVEGVVDDNTLRHDGRIISAIGQSFARAWLGIVGQQKIVDVVNLSGDGLGIRVKQELCFVKTKSPLRAVLTVNLITVKLARLQPFDPGVPDEFIAVTELDDISGLAVRFIEKEEENLRRVL